MLNADTDRPKFISNWDDLAVWTSNCRDGSYEVILRKDKPAGGNFFKLTDSTTAIFVREYIVNDETQKRFRLSIERIDQPMTVPAKSDSEERLAEKINNSVNMLKNAARVYLNMTRLMRQTIIGIKLVDDPSIFAGSLENKYYSGS